MSLTGKYERVSCENFDEFLTAMEVNDVWKKAAINSTPIMEVTRTFINAIVLLQLNVLVNITCK